MKAAGIALYLLLALVVGVVHAQELRSPAAEAQLQIMYAAAAAGATAEAFNPSELFEALNDPDVTTIVLKGKDARVLRAYRSCSTL